MFQPHYDAAMLGAAQTQYHWVVDKLDGTKLLGPASSHSPPIPVSPPPPIPVSLPPAIQVSQRMVTIQLNLRDQYDNEYKARECIPIPRLRKLDCKIRQRALSNWTNLGPLDVQIVGDCAIVKIDLTEKSGTYLIHFPQSTIMSEATIMVEVSSPVSIPEKAHEKPARRGEPR